MLSTIRSLVSKKLCVYNDDRVMVNCVLLSDRASTSAIISHWSLRI